MRYLEPGTGYGTQYLVPNTMYHLP